MPKGGLRGRGERNERGRPERREGGRREEQGIVEEGVGRDGREGGREGGR